MCRRARTAAGKPEGFKFCGFCKASLVAVESEVRKTVTVLFAVLRSVVTALCAETEATRGNFDLARTLAAEAKALAEEFGLEVSFANRALKAAGHIEELAGDLKRAELEYVESVAILRRLGDVGHLSSVAPRYADVLHAQGRYDDALALTEEARTLTMEGDVHAEVHWRRVQAKVRAHRGEISEGLRLATEAVDLARPTDNLNLRGMANADLAEVVHLAERDVDASVALREAFSNFELKGNVVMAKRMTARLAELALLS